MNGSTTIPPEAREVLRSVVDEHMTPTPEAAAVSGTETQSAEEAVAAATAPLQTQINELLARAETAETRVGELEGESAAAREQELQNENDRLTAELSAANARVEELEQAETRRQQDEEAAAAREALRGERVQALTEIEVAPGRAMFDDSWFAANTDRYLAMSSEEFDAQIATFQAIAGKVEPAPGGNGDPTPAAASAMGGEPGATTANTGGETPAPAAAALADPESAPLAELLEIGLGALGAGLFGSGNPVQAAPTKETAR